MTVTPKLGAAYYHANLLYTRFLRMGARRGTSRRPEDGTPATADKSLRGECVAYIGTGVNGVSLGMPPKL